MKIIIYIFFILSTLIFSKNEVTINYKENEPLLGKNHYLKFGKIPIATYEKTIGYFSTVHIIGHNLEIKDDLKKITIKNNNEILKNQDLKWNNGYYEIKEIDLKGLVLRLRWDNLKKDEIGVMIEEWNFKKKNYQIEIEYQYANNIEIMKLNINMPTFNPNIYLNINSDNTILKKQEYKKDMLILKKIELNDYDMSIFQNTFKVKLNSTLSIGNEEYLNTVNLIPLIEKYPGIYIEEKNRDNIFQNTNEIVIGVKIPKDLNYNTNYKIFGNLLELNYGEKKKELLEKTLILDGKNKIERVIAIKKDIVNQKIYLDDSEQNYSLLEKKGKSIGFYKDLKLKIGTEEILIDENGNSEELITNLGILQLEEGKIGIRLKDDKEIIQGEELKFEILSLKNEIIEEILLKVYEQIIF